MGTAARADAGGQKRGGVCKEQCQFSGRAAAGGGGAGTRKGLPGGKSNPAYPEDQEAAPVTVPGAD